MATEHLDCAAIDEMLPAYAVDALDDADRAVVERHFAGCERHEDVGAWNEVALRLADLAPAVTPPEGLRGRVVAIPSGPPVPAEDAAPVEIVAPVELGPVPLEAIPGLPPTRVGSSRLPYALAAAFAAIAVFFAAWTAVLLTGAEEESAPRLAATTSADGIDASATFIEEEGVALVRFDGLTPLPAGSDYQLWAIGPGADPAPAGILAVVGSHALASVEGEFAAGWTFAVTIEPAGGSAVPSSDPIVAVQFPGS
ncbi:MAG: anti-sigma factor [Dehalococcoidia bacterium]